MKTSMMLARDLFGVIGVDNKLPWNVPADLALFKSVTMGKAVVMGRNTWNSLPIKPLPGRLNIVVTTKPHLLEMPDVIVGYPGTHPNLIICPSIPDAIAAGERAVLLGDPKIDELVFIGGRSIYEQVEHLVDEVHVSELNMIVPHDEDKEQTLYMTDFEDIGFTVISYEEVLDEGKCVLDYIRYARPLNK